MNFLNTLWKSFLAIFVLIGAIGCNGDDKGLLGGGGATEPPETRDVTIVKLMVSPKDNAIPVGVLLPLNANLLLSDGSIVDVTSSDNIIWSTSDESITKVNPDGTVEGMVVGDTTITAQYTEDNETVSDTARVMVTDAIATGLQVTPKVETLAAGYEKPFVATATFSDGTAYEVTTESYLNWDSSDIAMATVDTDGLAKGMSAGIVEVSAVANINGVGVRDTAELTITDAIATELRVSPEVASVSKGLTQAFKAEMVFSDGSTQDVTTDSSLTWTSSDEAIATIDTSGLATGVTAAASPTTIKAHISDSLNSTAELTVTDAVITSLEVSPDTDTTTVGQTRPFNVKAIFSDGTGLDVTNDPSVSWSTSDPAVASITTGQTIDNGMVTGVSAGTVEVRASTTVEGETIGDNALLNVTTERLVYIDIVPVTVDVGVGKATTLTARGTYTDGETADITREVDWTGQDTSVATVGNGVVDGGVVTGVALGGTTTIASLSDGYGNVVQSDPATINVVKNLESIVLEPSDVRIWGTETVQLTATGYYDDSTQADITDQVNWSVTGDDVVSVSATGLLSNGVISNDIAMATAELQGIVSNEIKVTACITLAGPCIDVLDFNGTGVLYTSSPSQKYLESIGGSGNSGTFYEESGRLDPHFGIRPTGDSGFYHVFHRDRDASALCDTYNRIALEGRTNWSLPLQAQLNDVTDVFLLGDLYNIHGWPLYISYWAADIPSSSYYVEVDMFTGDTRNVTFPVHDKFNYVSCISEP